MEIPVRRKVDEAASSPPRFCNAELTPAVPAAEGGASQEVADDKRKNTAKCARAPRVLNLIKYETIR